jgi:hypothetical protein
MPDGSEFHGVLPNDLNSLTVNSINAPDVEHRGAILAGLTNTASWFKVKTATKMQIRVDIETKILSPTRGVKQSVSILVPAGTEDKSHANFYHGGRSSRELRELPLTMVTCWG